MEPLKLERRMTAFRAIDAFTVEAYRVSVALGAGAGRDLGGELRRAVIRSGGAVVAASSAAPGGVEEREHLERARSALAESRYYLYLARRFGVLDGRRYRALTVRQDAALREISGVIDGPVEVRAPP